MSTKREGIEPKGVNPHAVAAISSEEEPEKMTEAPDHLYVVWTSPDRDVALRMAFMYTSNAKVKGWWKDVTLVVWGPSANLLAHDLELQDKVRSMKQAGVNLFACKACSDSYGVSGVLESLGIQVIYMGVPLTEALKQGLKVLTI